MRSGEASDRDGGFSDRDAAALVNEVEGHLLIEATRHEGRSLATRFTRDLSFLPVLTESQLEELERHYAAHYLALARNSWQSTARRAGQLQDQYEQAYRRLRGRLLRVVLPVAGAAMGGMVAMGVRLLWVTAG